ncbi:hypothetical protein [Leucobacter chironomi]|uniref:hypothetical protein n=1 Tax=Leucobacter chironomi TaxID=491918 RepID=UPI0003FA8F54|nr:hypothetical protein [Leucobacter chironomi]
MPTTRPYGSIAAAHKLANAAARRARLNPPRPAPRTPDEDTAVATLMTTRCHARHHAEHLIPATSTICLRCGTDARSLTHQETP